MIPYQIGSSIEAWPGLAKLVEEMGELHQVLGKIMCCDDPGQAIYWDGTELTTNLIEELGDVQAALTFFAEASGLPKDAIHARADEKLSKFRYWQTQPIAPEPPSKRGVAEDLADLLSLVLDPDKYSISPGSIELLTIDEYDEVAHWAGAVHLSASDNPILVPPQPDHLLKKITENKE